jgi:twitching motility protein PilJ
MAAPKNFDQEYKRAEAAYISGNYEDAAKLIDKLVKENPHNEQAALLRGHIYCYGLQRFDEAQNQYQAVLALNPSEEIATWANAGLEYAAAAANGDLGETGVSDGGEYNPEEFNLEEENQYDLGDLDGASESADVFASADELSFEEYTPEAGNPFANPFSLEDDSDIADMAAYTQDFMEAGSDGSFFNYDQQDEALDLGENSTETFLMPPNSGDLKSQGTSVNVNQPFAPSADFELDSNLYDLGVGDLDDEEASSAPDYPEVEDTTLLMSGEDFSDGFKNYENDYLDSIKNFESGSTVEEPTLGDRFSGENDFSGGYANGAGSHGRDAEDVSGDLATTGSDFLEEFDVFGVDDDLSAISGFNLDDAEDISIGSSGPLSMGYDTSGTMGKTSGFADPDFKIGGEDEIFRDEEQLPAFVSDGGFTESPIVSVEQGILAPLENAPLAKKHFLVAIVTGAVSAIVVAAVSFASATFAPQDNRNVVVSHLRITGGLMTLAAGIAGFGTSLAVGQIVAKQIKRSTDNLQEQLEAITKGNLNVTATVYSEDEVGRLASGFNQMARVILTTTLEAQRKAAEQEQAKEDLQRQVIRLLDDVEGAARGDLTVQAVVGPDVLGAVADSFNLTIQNLREIVQQVTRAARQVTKGANENEAFARSLSSDALRQAEELAVTLNSVKVMTDSIQRVAESAREAEEVARTASTTALKGGDAVERTVSGILQIRETVAETTRKVKRLAESSQEISKIVALISAIASRTNLLALNASIEAARAGEAGKGFAIVADEVRQLADRSAKSLREIEQIVLQIQGETSSVMAAMEEGVGQVIEGTKRAEQAKRSLEEIIQVSNKIDALVRSITADTVEQTLTSRAVTQVMQSVELTAQETSQEAQRVSGSLQNLVGVARDLLASVERFRVEAPEK